MNATSICLNGSLEGEPFDIPGGTQPVKMSLLRYEPGRRARVLVVRFPEGWERTETGWYETAEELVIIAGTLEISGLTVRPGDYAYFPARWFRYDMRAPAEVVAFARFSGPARWTASPTADDANPDHVHTPLAIQTADHPSPSGLGNSTTLHAGEDGSSYLLSDVTPTPAPAACELLDLETWEWRWFEEGEQVPAANRAFVRVPN